MPDPRFYNRAGPFTLGDLAGRVGASLAPGVDSGMAITDVGALDTAGPGDITFADSPKLKAGLQVSKASACLCTPEMALCAPPGCAALSAKDPRAAFASVAALFYPEPHTQLRTQVAADARVAPDAVIGPGAAIGPGAVIGAGVRIGANAVIGAGVEIGAGSSIGANVTLSHCLIGARVILHPGVQIGQDGFGFAPTATGLRKVPQLGRAIIQDDVEIGANSCVDRGALGDTVIGTGTKIDNLVQIGHNVQIGPHCVIVAQVGIAGSSRVGAGVLIGGQVAIADHLTVGDGARIGAQAGLIRDVPPGETVIGSPAKPIRQFWREVATLAGLAKRG